MSRYRIPPTETSCGRAQLTVIESSSGTLYELRYLPSSYHPSTPFCRGEQLYFGPDLLEARRMVRLVFGPKMVLPPALQRRIEALPARG